MIKRRHEPARKVARIQKVLNVVIANNIYPQKDDYMCNALKTACKTHKISEADYLLVRSSIVAYVRELFSGTGIWGTTLRSGLYTRGLPCNSEVRLDIYKDWANRPRLAS